MHVTLLRLRKKKRSNQLNLGMSGKVQSKEYNEYKRKEVWIFWDGLVIGGTASV